MHDRIVVRGAREHNLKNLTVEIPRDKLVVITGLSGSGKSSLAFDTIYAEGQRRYVESLSAYARQFLGQMEKPDVDQIDGLSPAISIDQKSTSHNPRSTVGTVTEVYDYLRLLFARVGIPHCPNCGRVIQRQSADQIVDAVQAMPDGSRILILAPLVRDRKGTHERIFEDLRKAGFVRMRVDGRVHDAADELDLDRNVKHTIEAVVDRLVVRREDGIDRTRLVDSVETALDLGAGLLSVVRVDEAGEIEGEQLFSQHFSCPDCGFNLPEIEPRSFSFNSPHGACTECQGLGTLRQIDPVLVVPNPNLSVRAGAIAPWSKSRQEMSFGSQLLAAVLEAHQADLDSPWKDLPAAAQRAILEGTGKDKIDVHYLNSSGRRRHYQTTFEGVLSNLQRRYTDTESEYMRGELEKYMSTSPCPVCEGKRLRPEILAVTVGERNIHEIGELPIRELVRWVMALFPAGTALPPALASLPEALVSGWNADQPENGQARGADGKSRAKNGKVAEFGTEGTKASSNGRVALNGLVKAPQPLSERDMLIAHDILREIGARAGFLVNVGLDYLTLGRRAGTLSGGEAQRIRLATQIGSQLMGVLYILDEPSIGLHQRDNGRLIRTLLNLRDVGNTVIVVEHDEEMMRSADWILDLGPGAGEHGGHLVAEGPVATIEAHASSLTGAFLSGRRSVAVPSTRRPGNGHLLTVFGARENNLKRVDVSIPLGTLTVVTGVSGSGKSTLVLDVLFARLNQVLGEARVRAGAHDRLEGANHLDKVIDIDQSPIGRTPRSNPATYTNLFTPIRDLFATLPDAKLRGYKPGRFSFNVSGGRCEACAGDGILKIEMQFLPDVYVPCEVCRGARYNRETLQIKYKDKSIAEVLAMTVSEAREFFDAVPVLKRKLQTLEAVGLGYLKLGQPAPTLSGGEAQRVKLSRELSRQATGNTLYILDEPTTGLHFADVERLLAVLQTLVDAGNTVLVIEHNLDIIKAADWLIDLGPEGGERGGYVLATGTPEDIAATPGSHTGTYLARVLGGRWVPEAVASSSPAIS